jgi:nicotinamidase-related amidase
MPERAALLVMDLQEAIVERYGGIDLLDRVARAIAAARAAGLLVVYVKVGFRPGLPEVSPRNRMFSRLAESGFAGGESPIHPAIAPGQEDVVVTKRRVSAFSGSDLELLLRAREVRKLALCGIATSGVVLSTVRAAADLDYELVVLEDCCLDADDEVHRVLVEKVFPRQADVMGVERWEAALAT